jgi:hypothetical protein
MRRPIFGALFLIWFCLSAYSADQPQKKVVPAQPSLNVLVTRLDAYWKLLKDEKRDSAAYFVRTSDRKEFRSGKTPAFSSPRIKSIELTPEGDKATVVVMVKRAFPPLIAEVDWAVTDQWQFEKGNWYVRYDPQPLPLPIKRPKAMTPEQTESFTREIRRKIHFAQTAFDFGTVNQGNDVVLKLQYTLAGSEPIPIIFRTSAPGSSCPQCDRQRGISIQGLKEESLQPGAHELSITVPTWNYDGPVKETFTLDAKPLDVHIPYEFSVQGNVYIPVSIIPKELRLKKGDREREIVLRNNSKTNLELQKYVSESGYLAIDPFPVVIPPGKQFDLKVKAAEELDAAVPNAVDHLAITFTAVDGFAGISYKVYLNTRDEKPKKAATPADDPLIQEMIRKNAIIPPNR